MNTQIWYRSSLFENVSRLIREASWILVGWCIRSSGVCTILLSTITSVEGSGSHNKDRRSFTSAGNYWSTHHSRETLRLHSNQLTDINEISQQQAKTVSLGQNIKCPIIKTEWRFMFKGFLTKWNWSSWVNLHLSGVPANQQSVWARFSFFCPVSNISAWRAEPNTAAGQRSTQPAQWWCL